MKEHFTRVNHDCFRITFGELTIYTDPYKVPPGAPPADLVLVSHDHFDHLSQEDIDRIWRKGTEIVAPPACEGKLTQPMRILRAGESVTVRGVKVDAVPAYNTNKHFHPKSAGYVGYVFEVAGARIYFAGDTDVIPEMAGLEVDVALLPVSGTYVMTPTEAATAARSMTAKLVIPMHYGDIIGTADDARAFAKAYGGEVAIL